MIKKIRQIYDSESFDIFKSFNKQGYSLILIANMIARLSTTGFPFLIAFFMSSYEVGAIKVFLSYISFFAIFAGLGIDAGIVRYCSAKRSPKERDRLFDDLFIIGIIFSLIVAVIMAIIAWMRLISVDSSINNMLLLGSISLPFIVTSLYSSVYLQAQRRFKTYAKLNVSLNVLSLPIFLILTILFQLKGFVIGHIISNILISIIMLKVAHRDPIKDVFKPIFARIRRIKDSMKFSLYSLFANAVGQLNYVLDIIMMSMLAVSVPDIGYYSIAQILIFGLRQFIMAANQISVPLLSKKFSEGPKIAREHYMKHKKFITMVSLIVFFAGLIFIPFAIKLLFGEKYLPAIPVFIILLAGLYFWSQYSIIGITLLAFGRSDINLYISSATLFVNIMLNYVLIRSFGTTGAATSMLATYIFVSIVSSYVFYKTDVFNEMSGKMQKPGRSG
jgi:O-antigen/teichoic acid export membrane protein